MMQQALLINIGFLLSGIALLLYSGDILVKGSSAIADLFKISPLVIGLTVVAFGTSAPELIVSLDSAITGHPEIALGNVIGSNIANIALVLALTVIILPMPVAEQTIKRSWPVMFISGVILFVFMSNNLLSRTEGIILFLMLILFIYSSIKSSKRFQPKINIPQIKNRYKPWVYFLMIVLASVGLAVGSRLLVTGASSLAAEIGISERVISITVVAFGTSVPELTASIIAAVKKESDISVGNIIGSNIFNIFTVLGLTSIVKPIAFNFTDFRIDLWIMMTIYILLFINILPVKKLLASQKSSVVQRYKNLHGGLISRIEGSVFIIIYIAYIFIIFYKK